MPFNIDTFKSNISKQKYRCPIQHIISTAGFSPWLFEPNDGVVTIASQKHISDMELIEIDYNHYEVVLSEKVIDIIKERIEKFQKN